jgi:ribonuclease D
MQYLDTAAAVARFAREIADAPAIALDTEGASFHRFVDRVYLMQLSTRTATAIVDPLPTGDLNPLKPLVESADVEIVFHDADYDLRLLRQDYGWATRALPPSCSATRPSVLPPCSSCILASRWTRNFSAPTGASAR